jgi:hypothetical protein
VLFAGLHHRCGRIQQSLVRGRHERGVPGHGGGSSGESFGGRLDCRAAPRLDRRHGLHQAFRRHFLRVAFYLGAQRHHGVHHRPAGVPRRRLTPALRRFVGSAYTCVDQLRQPLLGAQCQRSEFAHHACAAAIGFCQAVHRRLQCHLGCRQRCRHGGQRRCAVSNTGRDGIQARGATCLHAGQRLHQPLRQARQPLLAPAGRRGGIPQPRLRRFDAAP